MASPFFVTMVCLLHYEVYLVHLLFYKCLCSLHQRVRMTGEMILVGSIPISRGYTTPHGNMISQV